MIEFRACQRTMMTMTGLQEQQVAVGKEANKKISRRKKKTAEWVEANYSTAQDRSSKAEGATAAMRGEQQVSEDQATTSHSSHGAAPLLRTKALLVLAALAILCCAQSDRIPVAKAQTSLLQSLYLQPASITKREASSSSQPIGLARRSSSSNVCQVNDGESVAIVEIEESRGSDVSQLTNPLDLPISGSINEIELKIESETNKYFQIQDKRLKLIKPLDRDAVLKENSTQVFAQQSITSIYLQISCLDKRLSPDNSDSARQAKKVIIPVLVKVLDINDNAPKFPQSIYTISVDELTPVDTIILTSDQIQAVDLDSANNGLIEYSLVKPERPGFVAPSPQTIQPRLVQRAEPTTTQMPSSHEIRSFASSSTLAITTIPGSQFISITTTFAPPIQSSTAKSSSSQPTINLESEPIVNGPMEDGEDEEESDETLLASLNKDNNSTGDTLSESDSMVLMSSRPIGKRKRKRRSYITTNNPKLTTLYPLPAEYQTTTTTRAEALWTNLMSSHLDDGLLSQPTFRNKSPDDRSSEPAPYAFANRPADDDSMDYFYLEMLPNSNNKPVIRLKKQLDYESRRQHVINLMAIDRANNRSERLSSIATIIVKVLDGDDQGPAFVLDQTGCATGSVPVTTTSSLIAGQSEDEHQKKHSKREVRKDDPKTLSSEEEAEESQGRLRSFNLPKGFKVSDENFDFSDMSPSDEGQATVAMGSDHSAPQNRQRRIVQSMLTRKSSFDSANSPRKASPYHMSDFSCLSSQPFSDNNGQAEYFSTVMAGDTDYLLKVLPQQIKARDLDELNAQIKYNFLNGTPANYSQYFQINPFDATIKQIQPIDRMHISKFIIYVQAQEQTPNKLFNLAKLTIEVIPTDKNPPVLIPNSYAGFVEENSPNGTIVMTTTTTNGQANITTFMKINVVDDDYKLFGSSGDQQQFYEFETTSDAFKVNRDGFVYVNKWPLDRDLPQQPATAQQPPAIHVFQVTARQLGLASSKSISSPISINVTLLDLNDNPPIIANSSLVPIQMPATNLANSIKSLGFIRATDKDTLENSKMFFSIHHVSNNGRERFRLNEETGELEALGRFSAGEQFSLTLQVSDEFQRSHQGILEVFVIPGPNTGGPQFIVQPSRQPIVTKLDILYRLMDQQQADMQAAGPVLDNSRGYSVEINEGILPHSQVIQVLAVDPENDAISYSIIDGNINQDFYIDSKSGVIYVAKKLDREEVSAYHLLVQARDSGGLTTNRPVVITISDNNDENPIFQQKQYSFAIEENVKDRVLGRIVAQDSDAQENGKISYFLEGNSFQESTSETARTKPLFEINPETGELKLLEELDYERVKSYNLLVTAKDHGENPRSSSTSVSIRVIDIQDEKPYFEKFYVETRVSEKSSASHRIAQVFAKDPDSVAQISYVIKSGNSDLFNIDPQTGVIVLASNLLDYETQRAHTLLIGTLENNDADTSLEELSASLFDSHQRQSMIDRSPICRVDIYVTDLNDNAPQFVRQPLPVRIQDTVALGTVVARVQAEDLDGSEPNNLIKYELITSESSYLQQQQPQQFTSEKCAQSFMIDSLSGSVSVKSDLKRDSQSECLLIIRAHDSPQQQSQQLSSWTSLTIFIDHIAEISPSSMIGFADTSFTIELEENIPANTLIKVLPIVNKPKISFPLNCEITSGNELNKFYVLINDQRDCELRTRDPNIDYEAKQKYLLTLKLQTIGGSNQMKMVAQVGVNILDKNDNKPTFNQVLRYSHLTQQKFLAAIAADSPSDTQLIQLKATDLDYSHSNNLISYELVNENELENRFKINSLDGILRTSKPVEDIPQTRLPLRLKVLAHDNPIAPETSLNSMTEVLVNLIDDRHRIALVLKDSPTGKVLESKEELLSTIQERTSLIAGLEKAESLKIFKNGSLDSDVSGTDFWFYLIEPGTFRIITNDDPRVKATLFDSRAQNSLIDVINQSLGFQVARVRMPYNLLLKLAGLSAGSSFTKSFIGPNGQNFPSLLILIALFIAITSSIVVIYQCGFWSSYNDSNQMLNQATILLNNEKFFIPQTNSLASCNQAAYSNPGFVLNNPANCQDQFAFRSSYSTLNNQQQQQQQQPSGRQQMLNDQPSNIHHQDPNGPIVLNNKEYETQMLKMSVLFDDNNSVDEQNLHANSISKNLNHFN